MLINLRNALMSGKRLPYDAELEYLESTGTQWIDTGVVLNQSSAVELGGRAIANEGFSFFGARVAYNSRGFVIARFSAGWLGSQYGSRQATQVLTADDKWHVFRQIKEKFSIDEVHTYDYNKQTFDTPHSALLFCQWDRTAPAPLGQMQISYCKIWDANGNLVRDFIPVRKGTVGYLYDRVTGKLFGNAGTGDFVLGQDVVPVEWLESDGNQYIDTGVKPDATYTFDSTVAVMQSNYNCTYWGCRSSGSYQDLNNQCYLASNTSGSSQRIYYYLRLISTNAGDDSNWNSGIIPETGRMYDFSGITTVSTMNAMTYPVVLFGLNIYGTINSASGKVRIAKWTPYKSGVRVNDFRPVRIGTDATSWEGAMMDVLTRRIYRNAGTGAFGYGNDLKYPTPAS